MKPFLNYPKQRSVLPQDYAQIHMKHLMENRSGATRASWLVSKMESWMHRQVARDIRGGIAAATLELGAGTLNHLPYEPSSVPYDIIEPGAQYYQSSPWLKRIRRAYAAIDDVPGDQMYDRVISIAVLEHLEDLPRIVASCGLHLKPHGCFRAGIPNEGTLVWTLGYRLTTGVEFRRRYGLDYSVIMNHEHVNTADEIEEALCYFFKKVNTATFGPHKALGFYRFLDCQAVDHERCREYLKSDGSA